MANATQYVLKHPTTGAVRKTNTRATAVELRAHYGYVLESEQPVEVPAVPQIAQPPVPHGPAAGGPDESWTKDDIKGYADRHGIDMTGAATKADMLAAVSDAGH